MVCYDEEMKADALFVIACFIMIYVAWVVTGGPTRPISTAGPYITPVTRSGEESQGYRVTPPVNPLDANAYPRQIGGVPTVIGRPAAESQPTTNTTNTTNGSIDLHAN